jgi:Ribosomal protein L7/L12 C-terminal domain
MKIRLSSKYLPCPRSGQYNSRNTHVSIINCIKAVRTLTRMGLKDAKDFVDELVDKGGDFSKSLETLPSLKDSEVLAAIHELRTGGLDVFEVEAEGMLSYRDATRKMITSALENDNIALARDLFNLYEKHFSC